MNPLVPYRPRKATNAIILHDSHSPPAIINGDDFLTFMARRQGLLSCGYHYIIDRDGQLVESRKHDTMGSHCPGRNHDTIGVCLMGGLDGAGKPIDNVLAGQWLALRKLVAAIRALYGYVPVLAHMEVCNLHGRVCPCVPLSEIRGLNTPR